MSLISTIKAALAKGDEAAIAEKASAAAVKAFDEAAAGLEFAAGLQDKLSAEAIVFADALRDTATATEREAGALQDSANANRERAAKIRAIFA